MDKLNRDILFLISEKLDLPNTFNLLKSSKKFYEKSEEIFLYKLNKDFPKHKICKPERTNKRLYVKLYQLDEFFKQITNIDICQVYNLHLVNQIGDKEFLDTFTEILALLLKIRNLDMRIHCIHLSFRWISLNPNFLQKYERFKHIAQQKLKELRNDPLAEHIIKDFGHIQFI